ncbi:glutathione S-transferase theta-1-like [Pseudophryne corroboree]|uniref:glutathione S-transferase theta-1-like n=1 Tax=Pseudophryne corroboree TaxID=495146 RepID=UPI0030820AC8
MSDSKLELYLDLLSQPCRSVYLFAKVNNIPFQHHEVKVFKGDHLREEFKEVNPLLKVPVLKDGDFTLVESTAMLRYLVQKFNTPEHWYPSDAEKRAHIDECLTWQYNNTSPHACKVFWLKCMNPAILGLETAKEKLDYALAEFTTILTLMETKFLYNRLFLAGDEFSLADLVAIADIMQVIACGIPIFEERPKLGAWKQRLEEELGSDLFKEAHDDILHIKEKHLSCLSPEAKEQFKSRMRLFINCGMWLC